MKRWLVSVAVGGAFDAGPSVLVEAEEAEDAAREGAEAILENDHGYGAVCSHCDQSVVREVVVVELAAARRFQLDERWIEAKT